MSKNINNILIGTMSAIFLSFISFFILSAILTYTGVQENIEHSAIIIINAIAVLVGSMICIRKQKKRGIFKGIICGAVYIGIMYLISSFIKMNFTLNTHALIMILTSIISGGTGGVIAINLK